MEIDQSLELETVEFTDDAPPNRRKPITIPLAHLRTDKYSADQIEEWDDAVLEDLASRGGNIGPSVITVIVGLNTNLNQKYSSIIEARKLWNSDDGVEVQTKMKEAVTKGTFIDVYNLLILQNTSGFDHKDIIKTELNLRMDSIQDKLRQFILEEFQIFESSRFEQPPDRMRMSGSREMPDLLLDQVGLWSDPVVGGEMANIIAEIFDGVSHAFIYNTSGSGKTRHVFEGLCHKWGFYLTCAKDNNSTHGSYDLNYAIDTMLPAFPDFTPDLTRSTAQVLDVEKNRQMAERCLKVIWLARLLVFELFTRTLEQLDIPFAHEGNKRTWLLIQATPHNILHCDIFFKLVQVLSRADDGYLKDQILLLGMKMDHYFNYAPPFVVVDEAQYALTRHTKAFLSGDGKDKRSVMREIIAVWCVARTLIMCGTGISKPTLMDAMTSATSKYGGDCKTVCDLAAFDDRAEQEGYMLHYMYSGLKELPSSWQTIIDRAWRWLRGRRRFTASYISLLLKLKGRSPHHLLNEYVNHLTGFWPSDAVDLIKTEENLTHMDKGDIKATTGVLTFNSLETAQDKTLKTDILWLILKNRSRSEPRLMSEDYSERAVELGFARLQKHPNVGNSYLARIDEPLVLLAASSYCNFHEDVWLRSVKNEFAAPRSGNHGDALEQLLALYFLKTLNGKTPLNEILRFVTEPSPEWATGMPQLVARVRPSGKKDGSWKTYSCGMQEGPSPIIGYTSKSPEETLDWLYHNEEGIPFCYPDDNCGPDLLFLIKVGKTLVWVAVQAKCICQKLSTFDTIKAVRVISPFTMYCNTTQKERNGTKEIISVPWSPVERPGLNDNLLRGFKLDNGSVSGDFPVLRLIASYPVCLDEDVVKQEAEKSEAIHPLAMVDIDRLRKVLVNVLPKSNDFILLKSPTKLSKSKKATKSHASSDSDSAAQYQNDSESDGEL